MFPLIVSPTSDFVMISSLACTRAWRNWARTAGLRSRQDGVENGQPALPGDVTENVMHL